jgi:hypothetical protein
MNQAQKIQAGVDFDSLLATSAKRITVDVPVIFDEDGEPVAGFRIVGKNSPEYQAESHAARAEGYQKSAKRKTAIDASTAAGSSQLVDVIDGNQKRLALAVVVESYGFESAGEPVQLTKEQTKAGFDKFPTWTDRVSAALEKDADFLKV